MSEKPNILEIEISKAFDDLQQSVYAALETYSNVHRGSGHNSQVTTYLYEQARQIVIDYLGLKHEQFDVIFCTPHRAELLKSHLNPGKYQCVSSQEFGLPLAVRVMVVDKKSLPGGIPYQSGGGTARLVAPNWVIWAKSPDKFEAGTPAIINIIAFAQALRLIQKYGIDIFQNSPANNTSANDILYQGELEKYHGRELLDELRKTLIGLNIRVPTTAGWQPFINLDNSASTPTFMPIWNTVWQTWSQPKWVQREIIHEVKSICAETLGAPLSTYEVIFTSNTTESINLVADTLRRQAQDNFEPVVLNTLLEHNSNELPWRTIPGYSHIHLAVDADGFIDLEDLETVLYAYNKKALYGKKRIKIVAVCGASNVLGVFNDLSEISRIVHRYNAHLLVDAAQMVAHRKVEMDKFGIDYLAFSAHKVYAPFGCGVLLVRKGLLNFSVDEFNLVRSSGEENVGGIAALGKALLLIRRIGLDIIQKDEQDLTQRLLNGLLQIPDLKVYGVTDINSSRFTQKGGVIVFSLRNIMPSKVAAEMAERGGIGVRYGCHCAHLLIKRLVNIHPFLERFQGVMMTVFPNMSLPGLVRVSLGIENHAQEIDALLHVLTTIAREPQKEMGNPFSAGDTRKPSQKRSAIQQQLDDFVFSRAQIVYK